jgi:hypothetical protein
MGDGEKLLKYLNSALNVLLGTDIFPRVPKKLNFVAQCNRLLVVQYNSSSMVSAAANVDLHHISLRGVCRLLVGKPEGKRPLGRPRRR